MGPAVHCLCSRRFTKSGIQHALPVELLWTKANSHEQAAVMTGSQHVSDDKIIVNK